MGTLEEVLSGRGFVDYHSSQQRGDDKVLRGVVNQKPSTKRRIDENSVQANLLTLIHEGNLAVSRGNFDEAAELFSKAGDNLLKQHSGLQYEDLYIDGIVGLGNALLLSGSNEPKKEERFRYYTNARDVLRSIVAGDKPLDPNHGERNLLYAKALIQLTLATSDEESKQKKKEIGEVEEFPRIDSYRLTRSFNEELKQYFIKIQKGRKPIKFNKKLKEDMERIADDKKTKIRFTEDGVPQIEGLCITRNKIGNWYEQLKPFFDFVENYQRRNPITTEMPVTKNKGRKISLEERKELLTEAVAHLINAEKAGLPDERVIDLYDHMVIAIRELRVDEGDQETNRAYRGDLIVACEKAYDHITKTAKAKGKAPESYPSLATICLESAKLYRDAALELRRGNSAYKPAEEVNGPKPSAGELGEVVTQITGAQGREQRIEEQPDNTSPTHELGYIPGDYVEQSPNIDPTYIDRKVSAALKQAAKGGWDNVSSAINKLKKLVTNNDVDDLLVKQQAYAGLSVIHTHVANYLTK